MKPVAKQNFRTAVFHCATECCKQTSVTEECCSAKINQFNAEAFVNDDIFIFDVAMYNAERIQVGQRRHQLHIQAWSWRHSKLLEYLSHKSYINTVAAQLVQSLKSYINTVAAQLVQSLRLTQVTAAIVISVSFMDDTTNAVSQTVWMASLIIYRS